MGHFFRAFPAFCILVAATAAAADLTSQESGTPVPPHLQQQVRAFLDHFVDPDKSPAEQAALFANPSEYYEHGTVGTADIVKDVRRFQKQWPQRNYWVTDVPAMVMDPATGQVFVSYTIGFDVANSSRSLTGKAHYGAVLSGLDASPKVEWIRENVMQRSSGASSGR